MKEYIFYSFALFAICYEYIVIKNPSKSIQIYKSIRMKNSDFQLFTDKELILVIFNYLYILWVFVGTFTSQWLMFLVIFLLSFLSKNNKYIRVIDSVITFLILLFIVLNKFHLHIQIP